jgi:hypothetical protein
VLLVKGTVVGKSVSLFHSVAHTHIPSSQNTNMNLCGVAISSYLEYGSSTLRYSETLLSYLRKCTPAGAAVVFQTRILTARLRSSIVCFFNSFRQMPGQCIDEAMTDDRNPFHELIYQPSYHEHDVFLIHRQRRNLNH